MRRPVLVRIEETDDGETASVDDVPVARAEGESAREAALRTVLTDLVDPRAVDIHTPSGVVLHVEAWPGGRLRVLGQSRAPRGAAGGAANPGRARGADGEASCSGAPGVTHDSATGTAATGTAASTVAGEGGVPGESADDTAAAGTGPSADVPPGPGMPPPPIATSLRALAHRRDATDEWDWAERDDPWPQPERAPTPTRGRRSEVGPRCESVAGPAPHPTAVSGATVDDAAGPLTAATDLADTDLDDTDLDDTPAPRARRFARRRGGWILPVALCTVLGLGTIGAATLFGRGPATTVEPVVTGLPFPQAPPDGWAAHATWASPPLDPATRVAVTGREGAGRDTADSTPVTDGPAVAFATAAHTVQVVDAASGRPLWSAALPEGDLTAGPALTRLEGVGAFAVQVGGRALVWAVADGRVLADVEIPPRSELVTEGTAPMVRITTTRAGIVTADGVAEVDIPTGATALAGREDGTVLAASPAGWWHLGPATVPGEPTPWEPLGAPGDHPRAAPAVVGMVGSSILLAHPDPVRPRLAVHHDGVAVRATFQDAYIPSRHPTWAPSASGSWGILGRSLVDVDAGRVEDLGDWRTALVGVDHAYGVVDEGLERVTPGARPTPVTVRSALVEADSPTSGFVRAPSPEGPRVWALPPVRPWEEGREAVTAPAGHATIVPAQVQATARSRR